MNVISFDNRDGSEILNVINETQDTIFIKQFERKCGMLFMRMKKRMINN